MTAVDWSGLETRRYGRQARSLDTVDSTNRELWAWEEAGDGAVCVAGEQTAGRGRQGRTWRSEAGTGLYLSVLVRSDPGRTAASTLSLVAGAVVAEAIEGTTSQAVGLKWPNDLLAEGRKLGGILLESRGEPRAAVVIGIGLNLRRPEAGWGELGARAVSLAELGVVVGRDALLCAILNRLEPAVDRHAREGLGPFLTAWRNRCALTGSRVRVECGTEVLEATVLGLADDGTLRVQDHEGHERHLFAGEVHFTP